MILNSEIWKKPTDADILRGFLRQLSFSKKQDKPNVRTTASYHLNLEKNTKS